MKGVTEKRREGTWAAEKLWVVLVHCVVYCGAGPSNASSLCGLKGVFIYLLGTNVCYCHSKGKIIFSVKHIVFLGSLKLNRRQQVGEGESQAHSVAPESPAPCLHVF